MALSPADRDLVEAELGREPTPAEAALFENLWSEHCAYRSSRPLLSAFESNGPQVVVGPGDDAAVVSIDDDVYVTLGIESHNHPSYVDPYDGAATGVGGIVRDTLSMGAYPIALGDALYFGDYEDEHAQYLFDGVVDGISDYGNSIGVPTVTGSVQFHEQYEGNPLVNVACVGLLKSDRLVTAAVTEPGNKLVLVGNATGRDGLGGASFASEDLSEDAETEDRPAVQVGDPYTEKLLIEANEALLDEGLLEAARDLGAAGLGGASSEMVAKGDLGAVIDLESVHQREPNMVALEILLAESQERMCYEVKPENVAAVEAIAERFDLGCSVIGEVTNDRYVCRFEGETVVDVPAEFLADGAPMNDLARERPTTTEPKVPSPSIKTTFDRLLDHPNCVSREFVYRQYDHEVGLRTTVPPGDDAAVIDIPEGSKRVAFTAGANPSWTALAPYDGARAVGLDRSLRLAAMGARPHAAVDCLNGGNPEKPHVYDGFSNIVDGLAAITAELSIPVVGGNVSLYNDSVSGPIPPTPTTAMIGLASRADDHPRSKVEGNGTLMLVGDRSLDGDSVGMGGSQFLEIFGGSDSFPALPDTPKTTLEIILELARDSATTATAIPSNGGLAMALASMVTEDAGISIPSGTFESAPSLRRALYNEQPGRAIIETTDPATLRERCAGTISVHELGKTTTDGRLTLNDSIEYGAGKMTAIRDRFDREMS